MFDVNTFRYSFVTNVTLWTATRIQQDFLLTRIFFSRLSIVKDIKLLRLSIIKGITLSKQIALMSKWSTAEVVNNWEQGAGLNQRKKTYIFVSVVQTFLVSNWHVNTTGRLNIPIDTVLVLGHMFHVGF